MMHAVGSASGPVALVTGAAGGIGAALVLAFEQAGWTVVSTDRKQINRERHISGDLGRCANPADPEGRRLIEALSAASEGRLKVVVHNAAHQVIGDSTALTPDDWSETLSVNLLAPFWISMAFRDELQSNAGSVLAISSIHEKLTKPGFVAYATSKAALSGLIRAMAVDLGGRIRCNAICPAAIATPMLMAGFADRLEAYQQLQAHHPSGRIGTPEEVAALAVFMCSDAATFINGACVDLSGGISVRLHDPI